MGAHYKPSYRGVGEMLVDPFMQGAMHHRAEAIAARAEAIAPVATTGKHRGRYKASFHVTSGIRVAKTTRAYGRVSNDAPEALAVEYGTANNPAHHTLMIAALAIRGERTFAEGSNTPRRRGLKPISELSNAQQRRRRRKRS